MSRRIALFGILLSTLAVASCADSPQAPSPPPQSQASASPSPPNPGAPPDTGKNSNPASGLYGLTLTIGPSCTILPEAKRTRQYSARLADDGPGRYVVTLGDASFLTGPVCTIEGLDCNQFRAVEEADTMRFVMESGEWHGGTIVERTTAGTWLEIYGEAVGARHPSSIEASGSGGVWYCPTSSGYPFPCFGSVACKSDLRLVFAKK